jgi:hypothetical protein
MNPTPPPSERQLSLVTRAALLQLAAMPLNEQQYFIMQLNTYLFASPAQRKRLVQQWQEAPAHAAPEAPPEPDAD